MKTKKTNIILYLLLFLFCTIALIAINLLLLYSQVKVKTFDETAISNAITNEGGKYVLSEQVRKALKEDDDFLMLLDDAGKIILSENLPKELNKQYSLKDVASFTRYYLRDYPVQTFVIDKGLLIIGEPQNTEWKYNLVYRIDSVQNVMHILPLMILSDLLLLVLIPLHVQKKFLRRKELERTEWIAGVSHDIRTPLTLIMGHADQVRKDPQSENNKAKAEIIEKQGERIRNLITNLNISSKLDFGLDRFDSQNFKVAVKVRKILVDFINQEFDQNYTFDFDVEDNAQTITLFANEILFQRIIENLINNSTHHNPDGCNIRIKIKKSFEHSYSCIIELSDDGVGVSDTELKKLNSSDIKNSGSIQEHGIGLQIVKQIVHYYKWHLHFETPEHGGLKVILKV